MPTDADPDADPGVAPPDAGPPAAAESNRAESAPVTSAPVTSAPVPSAVRARRRSRSAVPPPVAARLIVAARVVLVAAAVITMMLIALLIAMFVDDDRIAGNPATATATVLSVSPLRTGIEFVDDSGVTIRPPGGVLYPGLLSVGQQFVVEYSTADPTIVRVAGRTAAVGIVMVAGAAAICWAIAGPALWWLRRRSGLRLFTRAALVIPGRPPAQVL